MSSIKIRTRRDGNVTHIRVLIQHPMETGRRRDEVTGALIPAHFITNLDLMHNGDTVVEGRLSTAVSRNPYFSFSITAARPGDRIRVRWRDNRGEEDQLETELSPDDN